MAPRKYLLVAAMPTPNGALHLGHVGAQYLPLDVFRRYQEQQGNRVAYYGGFDVFDNAVCIAAQRNGRTPQEHAALVTTQITDPEREPWAQQLSRRYTHHSQLAGILEHVE
jgi:methionyl-tRNA synthetase